MESAFLKYFGDSPIFRVIDFLIDNHIFDYSVTTVSKETNTAKKTVYKIFSRLLKNKCLIKTRIEGKNIMYKLNLSHPFIKGLMKMDYELAKSVNVSQVKNEKEDALIETVC